MSKIILEEQASQPTPGANKVAFYPMTGGGVFKKDDEGVEKQFVESGEDGLITKMTGLEDKGIPEAKVIHTRGASIECIAYDADLTVADGLRRFTIPVEMNGMILVSVGAHVYTGSSDGLPSFQIHNLTDGSDMLSTVLTIDENEKDSKDAETPAVIDTEENDVVTGDELRFDCDVAGTGTKGMEIRMGFRLP